MPCRTLISKSSPGTDSIERNYVVSVEGSRVVFDYLPDTLDISGLPDGSQRYRTVIVDGVSLPGGVWHHVAVTVYAEDAAVYVNGTVEGVQALEGKMVDANRTVLLGQTSDGEPLILPVSHLCIQMIIRCRQFQWADGRRVPIHPSSYTKVGWYRVSALQCTSLFSRSLGRCKSCTKEAFHSAPSAANATVLPPTL